MCVCVRVSVFGSELHSFQLLIGNVHMHVQIWKKTLHEHLACVFFFSSVLYLAHDELHQFLLVLAHVRALFAKPLDNES